MAGVMKTNSDGFKRFDRGAISHRLEQLECIKRLRYRIKRCRNTALDLTTVTRTAVIFYSMPVWMALGAHFHIQKTSIACC